MSEVWTMGELLVEIMRPRSGMPLGVAAEFLGPFPSGAPAIFIDTAARLGHSAAIIGGVGDDEFGSCVVERLRADGVDTSGVLTVGDAATAAAFVTYLDDGSRRFIFHLDNTAAVHSGEPSPGARSDAKFFHVMGCSLMINPAFRSKIVEEAEGFAERGARLSFDPNIRPELLRGQDIHEVVDPILTRCAVLLPGEAELELLTGTREIEAGCRLLFARYPLEVIVVKRGKQGSTILTADEAVEVRSFSVEEIDPTGAGDCFDAGFLCGMLEGRPLVECGRIAAAAGALNASAFGPMEGKISAGTVEEMLGEPSRGPLDTELS